LNTLSEDVERELSNELDDVRSHGNLKDEDSDERELSVERSQGNLKADDSDDSEDRERELSSEAVGRCTRWSGV